MLATVTALALLQTNSVAALEKAVDDYRAQSGVVGASLVVSKNGKLVYQAGFGFVDRSKKSPARPDTVFLIGSVTKQFVADAVQGLAKRGKLSLTDSVRKYIPELEKKYDDVTLAHLLHHTSGMPAYTDSPRFMASKSACTLADVLATVKSLPRKAAVGEKWEYCNTGYYLLGVVVERVSGKHWNDYLAAGLWRQAGLKHTFRYDLKPRPEESWNFTLGKGAPLLSRPNPANAEGAGACASSGPDLAKWVAYLSQKQPALVKALIEPGKLASGAPTDYASGWIVPGRDFVWHNGAILGGASIVRWYPETGSAVIFLQNAYPAEGMDAIVSKAASVFQLGKDRPVIADDKPENTARIVEFIHEILENRIDFSKVGAELGAAIKGSGSSLVEYLKGLGEFEGVALHRRTETADGVKTEFTAKFKKGALSGSCLINHKGLVLSFGMRPAD